MRSTSERVAELLARPVVVLTTPIIDGFRAAWAKHGYGHAVAYVRRADDAGLLYALVREADAQVLLPMLVVVADMAGLFPALVRAADVAGRLPALVAASTPTQQEVICDIMGVAE